MLIKCIPFIGRQLDSIVPETLRDTEKTAEERERNSTHTHTHTHTMKGEIMTIKL